MNDTGMPELSTVYPQRWGVRRQKRSQSPSMLGILSPILFGPLFQIPSWTPSLTKSGIDEHPVDSASIDTIDSVDRAFLMPLDSVDIDVICLSWCLVNIYSIASIEDMSTGFFYGDHTLYTVENHSPLYTVYKRVLRIVQEWGPGGAMVEPH